MNKKSIITILFALIAMTGQAQITIKGSIINERGEKVEYVSIGLEEDSIGTISDANGNFTIEIPANRKNDLVFTHVSFQRAVIPYEIYANGQQLTVTMKDKECNRGTCNRGTVLLLHRRGMSGRKGV